jgi:hypothetical protein
MIDDEVAEFYVLQKIPPHTTLTFQSPQSENKFIVSALLNYI